MTPSELEKLSPLEAAARALEWVLTGSAVSPVLRVRLPRVAKELRAADRAVPTLAETLAAWIHYPTCWDTAAYPTLEDALHEMLTDTPCTYCKAQTINGAALPDGNSGSSEKALEEAAAPPSASRKDQMRKFAEDFQQGKAMPTYAGIFDDGALKNKAGPLPEDGWDKQASAEPVACLYVGSVWGEELQDWEIEANQKACERLNEQHAGKFATLNLYTHPPEADALLRLCLPHVVDDYDLHERIRAYLKAREGK